MFIVAPRVRRYLECALLFRRHRVFCPRTVVPALTRHGG